LARDRRIHGGIEASLIGQDTGQPADQGFQRGQRLFQLPRGEDPCRELRRETHERQGTTLRGMIASGCQHGVIISRDRPDARSKAASTMADTSEDAIPNGI